MSSEAQKVANQNKLDLVVKELVKRSAPFKRVFQGEDGKKVLQDLKAEFRKLSVVAETPHETIVRAAQYDVLDYIDKMINIKGEENEVHESTVEV